MREERNYWKRRLSRRTVIRSSGAAAIGAGTAAMIGCGGGDDDDDGGEDQATATIAPTQPIPTQAPSQVAKKGGALTFVMSGEPRTLDMHWDTFPTNTAITNNTNEALLKFSPDLSTIETEMASSMPEQPDELTYVFKIPQGIKFQNIDPVNGREFTSADIKYSIERQMTDDAGKFQHAYYFRNRIDTIETPDDYTVRFKTKAPYAPFVSYIASPWTTMIAKEAVEKWGDLAEHAVGTGPFIFKNWEKNVKFELVRNPDYRNPDLPYVDTLTYLVSLDANTRATLFIDKQIDAVTVGFSELSQVKDRRSDATYRPVPSQFWRQFRMPPTLAADATKGTPAKPYSGPYADPRVRKALALAIDSQEVLDLVYSGDGILTTGPILPIYPQWTFKEDLQKFNLSEAKALMEAAGMSDGFSETMIWASAGSAQNDQVGEVIKEQLKLINVDVTLQPMELAAYYNKAYAWDYNMSHHVPLNSPDPDENLSAYFGRSSTYYKFHDEAVWALIDKQAQTVDPTERQSVVQDAQRAIVEANPMKFMFTTNLHQFVDPAVKGWFPPTDGYDGRKSLAWKDA